MCFFTASKQDQLNVILDTYEATYQASFLRLFRAKLGIPEGLELSKELQEKKRSADKLDLHMLALMLNAMERKEADFTQTFR